MGVVPVASHEVSRGSGHWEGAEQGLLHVHGVWYWWQKAVLWWVVELLSVPGFWGGVGACAQGGSRLFHVLMLLPALLSCLASAWSRSQAPCTLMCMLLSGIKQACNVLLQEMDCCTSACFGSVLRACVVR